MMNFHNLFLKKYQFTENRMKVRSYVDYAYICQYFVRIQFTIILITLVYITPEKLLLIHLFFIILDGCKNYNTDKTAKYIARY